MSFGRDKEEKDKEFDRINAFFIGPKGANLPDFRANINTILDELLETRLDYMPNDTKFISKDVRRSKAFSKVRDMVGNVVRKTAQVLGAHSVPFWTPRYEGHMCTDMTMASLLGYFMTMLYNPNNVALEASPLTTVAEYQVGQQLCDLFRYNTDTEKKDLPLAWGHITCDGTIANLESIWVARNLKFYPLALQWAMKTEGALSFIPDFKVNSWADKDKGETLKDFRSLNTWELLNLRPKTVLDLPDILRKRFGITSDFLTKALKEFNIQTTGREPLEQKFEIEQPIQYLIGKTRHYSWPKGAAITGLGDGNITEIDVDFDARIDIALLEKKLKECAEKHQAVYAVVAIMGSTEEGAVERLTDILNIREKMQNEYGLSFLVHADAAWGGYFATMLNPEKEKSGKSGHNGLVPSLCLKKSTEEDLRKLKDVDSITVDPHKAGYVPYPAGSLLYRDGRMRYLVTWSSPYLSQGSSENIGIYGVEGSKPGAPAMSTWLSNIVVGLHPHGYGMLLGEAAYTSAILSAHYATMGHTPKEEGTNKYFVCVPFNLLNEERMKGEKPENPGGEYPKDGKSFFTEKVLQKRQQIREAIINQDNAEIQEDEYNIEVLRELGSDLNINAFALNWYDEDGNLNTDLEEANYLMKQVVDKLSITSPNTEPAEIPLFLTSTKFEPKLYGKCVRRFMNRLGVKPCEEDMFVIRNVVMSPFPTQGDFVGRLMKDFEKVIIEKVQVCRERNKKGSRNVKFLVQGNTKVFLVLQTSFHWATLRQQVIVEGQLDDRLHEKYTGLRTDYPGDTIILESEKEIDLEAELKKLASGSTSFGAEIYRKTDPDTHYTGSVTLTHVVKSRPLNSIYRDLEYPPEYMPFYLYGTKEEKHITHMLLKAPNAALSASNVIFAPELGEDAYAELASGLIVTLSGNPEAPMQPFLTDDQLRDPKSKYVLPEEFPFKSQGQFNVKVWKDPNGPEAKGPGLLNGLERSFGTFKMTLGVDVDVDAKGPNELPEGVHSTKPGVEDPKSVEEELNDIKKMITDSREGAS
ncbi:hypothetical protein CNMCM7691_008992 [Aspergillus felis]|uniref:L-tyrosine decarboxylase C-terminal domain-containing protein n=1 Tax=Aspergillus felis TaxID=1287682 RepID=A0A8H6QUM3_9EURO|nr:hypothetical protein CNMCM7691_008992 [Aspergillus felis]